MLGPGPKVSGNGNGPLGDGADGLGFRTIMGYDAQNNGAYDLPTGKVWGPYVSADTFKVSWEVPTNQTLQQPMLLDRWGTPIQYFPRYGTISLRTDSALNPPSGATAGPIYGNATAKSLTASGAGQDTFFDSRDATSAWLTASGDPTLAFKWMAGDDNNDNFIGSGETVHCTDPFVLISAGPDGKFCDLTGSTNKGTTFQASGNVYSFNR